MKKSMALPFMCCELSATPDERLASMALVLGERYDETMLIGWLAPTSW